MHLFTVDSYGYISGELIRTPLYPLLLKTCSAIFGNHGMDAVVAIQTLCALLAAILLVRSLRSLTPTPLWAQTAVFAVLAGPILLYSRVIITDTLAYALYLATLACALRFMGAGKSGGWLIAAACLNILVRPQMAFALPVLGGLFLLKRKYLLLAVLCGAFAAAGLADRTYHKIHNGVFMNSGIGAVHMARDLMYFSRPEDQTLFAGGPHGKLMKDVFARIENEKLSERFRGEATLSAYFTEISNQLAWNTLCDLYARQNPTAPQQDMIRFCKYVSGVMMPKYRAALPRLWLSKMRERAAVIAFALLLAALPLFSAKGIVAQAVSFLAWVGLCNYLLVACSSCFGVRMDFYSETALALAAVIAALGWRNRAVAAARPQPVRNPVQ